jgi:hypothetical protein
LPDPLMAAGSMRVAVGWKPGARGGVAGKRRGLLRKESLK